MADPSSLPVLPRFFLIAFWVPFDNLRLLVCGCFSCGKEVPDQVGRGEDCPSCGADLHCCRNCRFYDPAVYNECREPQAERVLEKERSNFCDWFSPGEGAAAVRDKTLDARKKLEELFKKK